MSPTLPEIDLQLSGAPSPPIPGTGDALVPPKSEISAAVGVGKRLGAKNVVRPAGTAVKASGKADGKRVEAPEMDARPPLPPAVGRRQSKPTPAKVALAEAVAAKKRKKAEASLLKAAAAPSTRKASSVHPPQGWPPWAAVVNADDREVLDVSSAR
jgi:hypothetical protein